MKVAYGRPFSSPSATLYTVNNVTMVEATVVKAIKVANTAMDGSH
jgi:hypothetical protein